MAGERMALLGCPGLLIAGFTTAVLGEWCGRAGPLGVVRFQISLVDTPATPRRNIRVVGLDRVLLESMVAGEVAGVLTEDPFVEVSEDWVAVGVSGDESSPVLAAAVAVSPLNESVEFASGVPAVVPALTAATLALVLEVPLERTPQRPRAVCFCPVVSSIMWGQHLPSYSGMRSWPS